MPLDQLRASSHSTRSHFIAPTHPCQQQIGCQESSQALHHALFDTVRGESYTSCSGRSTPRLSTKNHQWPSSEVSADYLGCMGEIEETLFPYHTLEHCQIGELGSGPLSVNTSFGDVPNHISRDNFDSSTSPSSGVYSSCSLSTPHPSNTITAADFDPVALQADPNHASWWAANILPLNIIPTATALPFSHNGQLAETFNPWTRRSSQALSLPRHSMSLHTVSPTVLSLGPLPAPSKACELEPGVMIVDNTDQDNSPHLAQTSSNMTTHLTPRLVGLNHRQLLPDASPCFPPCTKPLPSNDHRRESERRPTQVPQSKFQSTTHIGVRSNRRPLKEPKNPSPSPRIPKLIQPKPTSLDSTEATGPQLRTTASTPSIVTTEAKTIQRRGSKDQFLVRSKLAGMSYKEIRQRGGFTEAESTLRGRFRTLTKDKNARVRKPEWADNDVRDM